MLYRLLTAIGLLAAAAPAAADPAQLSSEAIRTTLAGALVNMDTPAGTIIPVRFGTDGLVSGEAGVLAPVLGAKRDRGRWWAEGDKLCMKWFRWFEAERRCVVVRMEGERLYWRGEDRSGTATIAEPAPVVEASAPKGPPAVETAATIELADTAPMPAATEAVKEPLGATAHDRAQRLAIRFAAASSFGSMSFAPSILREPDEPRHLLDALERQAIGATSETPEPTQAPAQAAPIPESKAMAAHEPSPDRKAPQNASAHASSTVFLASFRVAGVDEDDMLNVRSGPAIFYPSVGGLPPQERGVKIVGPCRLDWCPIQHGKMTGWVNRSFLAEDTSSPATVTVSR